MKLLAWFTPMAIGGCLLAILGGYLMHIVSGTTVLIFSSAAVAVSAVLFICAPDDPSYWAWIFPAMVCATISIDLIYSLVNVFLSTKLPPHQQGVAGSLAHSLVHFGGALLLGVASGVNDAQPDEGEAMKYRDAFWLQFACGVVTLIIFVGFVRVEKAGGGPPAEED